MSEIKWIKITTDMFEDEKLRLIDAMPERDTIHYIWIRLLVQAGKVNDNGYIFLNPNVPYTDEMLATIFCRPIASIRLALTTLANFRMIEISEENLIKITNWEKHQNVRGMELAREQSRLRMQRSRERKKLKEKEEKDLQQSVTVAQQGVTVTEQIENKKEKENKNKIENEIEMKIKEQNEEIELEREEDNLDDINDKAIRLLEYFEKITGNIGVLTLRPLKVAIAEHGYEIVKMAIDVAVSVEKVNMRYINGILKNWRVEGYPKPNEVKVNVNGSIGKNIKKTIGDEIGKQGPKQLSEESIKKRGRELI